MKKKHQSPEFLVICQDEANAKFFVASSTFGGGFGGGGGSFLLGGWFQRRNFGGGGGSGCNDVTPNDGADKSSDGGDMW